MKIGIDLDNTIIDYQRSFYFVAIKYKLLNKKIIDAELRKKNIYLKKSYKEIIKKEILKKNNGQKNWEFLQGKVYGKFINYANVSPYFYDFLLLCKKNKFQIIIISHKSKYGNQDISKINLRISALNFLKNKKIIGKDFNIEKSSIFFTESREEKIFKIKKLKCDYFIDDLSKILTHNLFPENTKKILFSDFDTSKKLTSYNWPGISYFFFKSSKIQMIKRYSNFLTNQKVKNIKKIKGRRNSDIFKVEFSNRKKYVGKFYPYENNSQNYRILNESMVYDFLNKTKIQISKYSFFYNQNINFALYNWHEGKSPRIMNYNYLKQFIAFVSKINNKNIYKKYKFNLASASCLSFIDIEHQIRKRFYNIIHLSNKNKDLINFVTKDLMKFSTKLIDSSKDKWPYSINQKLENKYMILSPSDYGLHNVIKKNDTLKFIDFEYFGWDDPAKFVSDFILHPSMKLQDIQKTFFVKNCSKIFYLDKYYKKRLYISYFLYSICWCLILLNDFLIIRTQNYSERTNDSYITNKQLRQLDKSKNLLKNIISEYKNGFPYE